MEFVRHHLALPTCQQRAIIVQLTVRYYDGWSPSRSEIADLGAVELNLITVDECLQRQRLRNNGGMPPSITEKLLNAGPAHRTGR